MKNYFLLCLVLLGSLISFAQITENTQKSFQQKNADYYSFSNRAGSPATIASVDTIWSDDFSDTTAWSYLGGDNEWNVTDTLPSALVGQGFDNAIMSTSGGNFAIIDSDGQGSAGTQNATIEYIGGTIDCSANQAVQLIFQTYLRQYLETREVFISGDGGTSWDSIQVLTQFTSSTTSSNPYIETVDISAYAGGKSDVKIRFRYQGGFDWFWVIDDVVLATIPENELELTQEYYNGTTDLTSTNFYTMIPLKQADSAIVNFGAEVVNNGVADQTNSFVSVDIAFNGNSVFSDTTDSVTIDSASFHLFDFQNSFQPDSGLGVYDIRMEVFTDSVDAVSLNNLIENQFEVSSYQYRRDNDSVTNDNWFDGNSWEMLVRYEIFEEDTVVALSTYFPFNFATNRGLKEGDSISYYVYESTDLVNPISVFDNYKIQLSDVNSWVSLPMPFEYLTEGIYYVGFKIHNNHSSVGTNAEINAKTAPLTVLVRTNALANTDPWQYTTSFTPFVRMFTKTNNGCTGVDINIDFVISDTSEYGSVDATISGTGAAPYNYEWTGPNGFMATTKNIDDLADPGAYYLTVTDVFGCSGIDTAVVAGKVNVTELEGAIKMKIAPNPNNGDFILNGNVRVSGGYEIGVYTITGIKVYEKWVNIQTDFSLPINMDNSHKGMYILKIASPKGQPHTEIIVIE